MAPVSHRRHALAPVRLQQARRRTHHVRAPRAAQTEQVRSKSYVVLLNRTIQSRAHLQPAVAVPPTRQPRAGSGRVRPTVREKHRLGGRWSDMDESWLAHAAGTPVGRRVGVRPPTLRAELSRVSSAHLIKSLGCNTKSRRAPTSPQRRAQLCVF